MTKDEALRLALEALETSMYPQQKQLQAITAIKAALEAKDEPLAYLSPTASPENACYTLPQRTWIGLMDEEIQQSHRLKCKEFRHWLDERTFLIACNWAESKLKDKNK